MYEREEITKRLDALGLHHPEIPQMAPLLERLIELHKYRRGDFRFEDPHENMQKIPEEDVRRMRELAKGYWWLFGKEGPDLDEFIRIEIESKRRDTASKDPSNQILQDLENERIKKAFRESIAGLNTLQRNPALPVRRTASELRLIVNKVTESDQFATTGLPINNAIRKAAFRAILKRQGINVPADARLLKFAEKKELTMDRKFKPLQTDPKSNLSEFEQLMRTLRIGQAQAESRQREEAVKTNPHLSLMEIEERLRNSFEEFETIRPK